MGSRIEGISVKDGLFMLLLKPQWCEECQAMTFQTGGRCYKTAKDFADEMGFSSHDEKGEQS